MLDKTTNKLLGKQLYITFKKLNKLDKCYAFTNIRVVNLLFIHSIPNFV